MRVLHTWSDHVPLAEPQRMKIEDENENGFLARIGEHVNKLVENSLSGSS
jgi:hypothetical protein